MHVHSVVSQTYQLKVSQFNILQHKSGVTVIWVPPLFVYPRTHITRDMSIPRGDTHSTGSENTGRKIRYSVFILLILQQTCICHF